MAERPTYNSKNNNRIKKRLSQLLSQNTNYAYDASSDNVYRDYRTGSLDRSQIAAQRTVNKAKGINNGDTYSERVASGSRHVFDAKLNGLVPQLEAVDYQKNQSARQNQFDKLSALLNKENTEYSRYRDDVSDWEKNRKLDLEMAYAEKTKAEKEAAAQAKADAKAAKEAEKAAKAAAKAAKGRKGRSGGSSASTSSDSTVPSSVRPTEWNSAEYLYGKDPAMQHSSVQDSHLAQIGGQYQQTMANRGKGYVTARGLFSEDANPYLFESAGKNQSRVERAIDVAKEDDYISAQEMQDIYNTEKADLNRPAVEKRAKAEDEKSALPYSTKPASVRQKTEFEQKYGVKPTAENIQTTIDSIDAEIESRKKAIREEQAKVNKVGGATTYGAAGSQPVQNSSSVSYNGMYGGTDSETNKKAGQIKGEIVRLENEKEQLKRARTAIKYEGYTIKSLDAVIRKMEAEKPNPYHTSDRQSVIDYADELDRIKNIRYEKQSEANGRIIESEPEVQKILDKYYFMGMVPDGKTNGMSGAIKELDSMGFDGKSLADTYIRSKNAENAKSTADAFAGIADKGFFGGLAGSVASVGSNIAGEGAAAQYIANRAINALSKDPADYRPVDYNAGGFAAQQVTGAVRNTVKENLEGHLAGLAPDAYDVVMSAVDSVANRTLFGELSIYSMASGAAASAGREAAEKGASASQVASTMLFTGTAEAITEMVELEQLKAFMQADLTGKAGKELVKEYMLNVSKQFANEAAGESANELIEYTADYFVNGGMSQYATDVIAAMDAGASFEEAKQQAMNNLAKQTVKAGIAGGLSGAISAVGATTANKIGTTIGNAIISIKNIADTTNAVAEMGDEGKRALIQEGLDHKGSTAEKLSQKLNEKMDQGKNVNKAEVAALVAANEAAIKAETKSNVESVVEDKAAGRAVNQAIKDGIISDAQAESILNDKAALQTVSEVTGTDLTAESSVDEVKEAAYAMKGEQFDTDTKRLVELGISSEELSLAKEGSRGEGIAFNESQVELNGKDYTLAGVHKKNGEAMIVLNDGKSISMVPMSEAAGMVAENSDLQKILEEASSFGPNGAVGFTSSYDGSINFDSYKKAYRWFYDAGLVGEKFDNVKGSAYTELLTDEQKMIAYNNGINDAKTDLDSRVDNVVEARREASKRKPGEKAVPHNVLVKNNSGQTVEDTMMDALQIWSDITGAEISIEDFGEKSRSNGTIYGNHISLNSRSTNPFLFVVAHEVTHYGKTAVPELYQRYKDAIIKSYKALEPERYQREFDRIQRIYENDRLEKAKKGEYIPKLTVDQIHEEMVCDATQAFVKNPERFRDAVNRDQSFGRKVADFLTNFAEWLKSAFRYQRYTSDTARFLEEQVELFDEAAQTWARMVEESGDINVNQRANEVRHAIETIEDNNVIKGRKFVRVIANVKRISRSNNPAREAARVLNQYRKTINTVGEGETSAQLTSGSVQRLTNPKKAYTEVNRDKLINSLGEIDELVKASQLIKKGNSVNKNLRSKGVKSLDTYSTIFMIDGMYFESVVEIYNYDNGSRTLGDIDKITDITEIIKSGKSNALLEGHSLNNFLRLVPLSAYDSIAEVDSDGNKISDEQKEFFEKSVAKEDDGRLLVLFHGTEAAPFSVFNIDKGVWLSTVREYSLEYSSNIRNSERSKTKGIYDNEDDKVYKVYANIENPIYLSEIDGYMSDTIARFIADSMNVKPSKVIELAKKYYGERIYSFTRSKEFINLARSYGYDGFVAKESGIKTFCAIKSEDQIKLVSNKKPTINKDIRFSLDMPVEEYRDLIAIHNIREDSLLKILKLGGFPMPSIAVTKSDMGHGEFGPISVVFGKDTIDPANKKNKVYSGDAWTPMFPSIEVKANDAEVRAVDKKIRSLIDPKIARDLRLSGIDSANIEDQFNRFGGDLSVIYGRNAALKYAFLKDTGKEIPMPMKEKNLSQYADNEAISKIADEIGADVIEEAARGGSAYYNEHMDLSEKLRSAINQYYSEKWKDKKFFKNREMYDAESWGFADYDRLIRDLRSYIQNGVEQEADTAKLENALNESVNEEEYNSWLEETFKNVIEKKGIRNGKDTFTPSGNRRSFEQLHAEITLENVVKQMLSDKEKGGSAFFAANSIFGAATKEYKSIDDIKADRARLSKLSEEEIKAMRSGYQSRLSDIANRMLNEQQRNSFGGLNGAIEAIVDALSESKNMNSFRRNMQANSEWYHIDDGIIQDIIDLVSDISKMPTTYFEAKPRRAVGFDEILAMIIPDNSSQELKDALASQKIPYEEYQNGNEEDRKKLLNNHSEARFSLQMNDDADLDYDADPEQDAMDAIAQETLDILEGYKITETQIQSLYNKMVAKNNSSYDEDAFKDKLANIALYLNSNYKKNAKMIMSTLQQMSKDIMDTSKEAANPENAEEVKKTKAELRGTQVVLTSTQLKDAIHAYGSLQNLRKETARRIKIASVEEMQKRGESFSTLDQQWSDLCDILPGLDRDASEGDMVGDLVEALNALYDPDLVSIRKKYGQGEVDYLAKQMANDMFLNLMSAVTPTNKKDAWNKLRSVYADKLAAHKEMLDKSYSEKLAKLKERYEGRNDRTLEAMARQRESVREQAAKRQENAKRSKYKKDARKIYDNLHKMLVNPTDAAYIPVDLVNAVCDVCQEINFDTGFRLADGGETQAFMKLDQMRRDYESMRMGESDYLKPEAGGAMYDARIPIIIDQMKEAFKDGRRVNDLTTGELEELVEGLSYIHQSVKKSTELIGKDNNKKTYTAAASIIEDVNRAAGLWKGRLNWDNPVGNFANTSVDKAGLVANKAVSQFLSPERFARRLVGYKDNSMMLELFDDLTRGEAKMHEIQMDIDKIMAPVMEGKENAKQLKRLTGSKAEWFDYGFTDDAGNPVRITPAMRVALYLHMQNNGNLEHIENGGMLIPNERLYKAGKMTEAYAQGTVVKHISRQTLQNILKDMTDYEKQFAKVASQVFNDYSKRKINETSLALSGYEKARVTNYFPISTDKDFLNKQFDSLAYDASITSAGQLKGRVRHAKNPIMLEEVTSALQRQQDFVSRYAGLAIPISNFGKVMNVSLVDKTQNDDGSMTVEYKDSMKKAIKSKWGTEAMSYIENMVTDLNGARKSSDKTIVNDVLNKTRGNLAAGVLTGNVGVMIKQTASYPVAIATLGYKPVAQALLLDQRGHTAKSRQELIDLIDKYSGEYHFRAKGNSTQELGDLNNQNSVNTALMKVPGVREWLNGIQKFDLATTRLIWKAAEIYVKDNHPDVKVGSDSYYRLVADMYNKTIHDTQPNYATMQRPEILRTNSEITKVMTMFMTQRLQNGNLMYDSAANMIAKQRMYKSDKSGENKIALAKAQKEFAATMTSQIISAAVIASMTAVQAALKHRINKYRDEEGNVTPESFWTKFVEDTGSSLAGSFLAGSELYDFILSAVTGDKYYGISDNLLGNINDFASTSQDMITTYKQHSSGNMSDEKYNEKMSKYMMEMGSYLGQMLGIPFANAKDMIQGTYMHVQDAMNGEFGSFEAGYQRKNAALYDLYYKAIAAGDEADIKKWHDQLIEAGQDEKRIASAMKKRLQENDIVNQAAEAAANGDINAYTDLVEQATELGYTQNDVIGAVDTINREESEGSSEAKDKKLYSNDMLDSAVANADPDAIEMIREDWLRVSTAEDPEKAVQSSITSAIKDQYLEQYRDSIIDGDSAERKRLEEFFDACGIDREKYEGWVTTDIKDQYKQEYLDAYMKGDTATLGKISKTLDAAGIDHDSWGKSDMKKAFAEAYESGDKTKMDQLIRAAEKVGIEEGDLWATASKEQVKEVTSSVDAAIKSFSGGGKSFDAAKDEAIKARDELLQIKISQGKSEKDAKSSIKSGLTSYYKPLYKDMSQEDRNRLQNMLLSYFWYDKSTGGKPYDFNKWLEE